MARTCGEGTQRERCQAPKLSLDSHLVSETLFQESRKSPAVRVWAGCGGRWEGLLVRPWAQQEARVALEAAESAAAGQEVWDSKHTAASRAGGLS